MNLHNYRNRIVYNKYRNHRLMYLEDDIAKIMTFS